jgi:hypothetical protein
MMDDGQFAVLTMHEGLLPRIYLLRPAGADKGRR